MIGAAAAAMILSSLSGGFAGGVAESVAKSQTTSETPAEKMAQQRAAGRSEAQAMRSGWLGSPWSWRYHRPGWSVAHDKRMARKRRNQARNRRAHR